VLAAVASVFPDAQQSLAVEARNDRSSLVRRGEPPDQVLRTKATSPIIECRSQSLALTTRTSMHLRILPSLKKLPPFLLRLIALLAWLLLVLVTTPSQAKAYIHTRIEGVINPIKVRQLSRAIERGQHEHAEFLLVALDTPGGLVVSMQEIVTALTNAPLPVVGFVEPESAQASSAGAFILLATDVAAMVPSTRVGAAHPVAEGKSLDNVMDQKATSSLAALAKSLALRRGRATAKAESMVRESASYTAEEAQAARLVELVVANESHLLQVLDGREVQPGRALHTRGLARVDVRPTSVERLLDTLAGPTLAALFLSLGSLAILYEFASPGIGAGGAVGALLLVLGLLGSSVVPLTLSGVVLLAIGLVAIALEFKVPTHGILGGTGLVATVLGALLLVDPSAYFGAVQRVRMAAVVPIVVSAAFGLILLVRVVRRALRAPPVTGCDTLVGRQGKVCTASRSGAPERDGQVFVDGARWRAYAENSEIYPGDVVEVVAVSREPTRLLVRRIEEGKHG
jgi:membrane-bound serine protease (ClpP class)